MPCCARLRWPINAVLCETAHTCCAWRALCRCLASRSGLDDACTADELSEALADELAQLGFGREQIAYIEAGRRCDDELALISRMAELDTLAEELEARRRARHAAGVSTTREMARLRALAEEYTRGKRRLKMLFGKPDLATGHAFVVFQLEADRNKCVPPVHHAPRRPLRRLPRRPPRHRVSLAALPHRLRHVTACAM
jgi:hypothetical protein